MNKVEVIRYLRPIDANGVSNLGGVTVVFNLDYDKREIDVKFSICSSKENFNKHNGVKVAKESEAVRTLPLDSFRKLADKEGGFIDAYFKTLDVVKVLSTEHLHPREQLLMKKSNFKHWRW